MNFRSFLFENGGLIFLSLILVGASQWLHVLAIFHLKENHPKKYADIGQPSFQSMAPINNLMLLTQTRDICDKKFQLRLHLSFFMGFLATLIIICFFIL